MKVINKIGLAVIEDRKLLMVRSRRNDSVFYILGGKPENGEIDTDCIKREVEEEVSGGIVEGSLQYLKEFRTNSHDKPNTIVRLKLYRGSLSGSLIPKNEVAEIDYFSSKSDSKYLSELTGAVITWLCEQGYID